MVISSRLRFGVTLLQRTLLASDRSFGNPSVAKVEGLRNFSSQVKATDANVKVPLTLFGGSGNYASALFVAASKANTLDKVESEILDVVAASKKSSLFSQFIKDLSVPRETRVKAIREIFAKAGFSDITKNFLSVLADNGRLRNIERIAKRFVELTMAHKGEVKVVVTTVIPLPAEEERDLKQTLKEILPNAKSVQIEQKIDPSILGWAGHRIRAEGVRHVDKNKGEANGEITERASQFRPSLDFCERRPRLVPSRLKFLLGFSLFILSARCRLFLLGIKNNEKICAFNFFNFDDPTRIFKVFGGRLRFDHSLNFKVVNGN